jgi:PTH1 family peptidyl-tRNA hydrolase
VKLIVGLGNPGRLYLNSRHNIGFAVVKALAKTYKISLKENSAHHSSCGEGKIGKERVILASPLTFMNLSGTAVSSLLKKYKIDLDSLLVVCDDLDLELGRLKIKAAGSSAGHRGLESIIGSLKNSGFCRLRLGIGRPAMNRQSRQIADYVLTPFSKKEAAQVKEMIAQAASCCRVWASEGSTKSMNLFNKRRNK